MAEELLQRYKALSVGDRLPVLQQLVDKSMIDTYAEASGDMNPLHIDPEFAKTTIFGKNIAHGLLTLAFISRVLSEWNWDGWAYGGELNVIFIGPVFPGDVVQVSGYVELIEKRGTDVYASCQIMCHCGDREVVKAEATLKV
jgi:3-hydroxybutyryl-CoA dehydratase